MLTHEQLVAALHALHPNVPFSYVGDGSTLGPHAITDPATGETLEEAPGLVWPQDAGPPPTLEEIEASVALRAEQDTAAAVESAWRSLRAFRDTWLAVCQVIFDEIKTPGSHDLSPAMAAAIAERADAWLAWRKAMRDLPARRGLDPPSAAAAAAEIRATDDDWPAPWPTPPAAPVIHR